MLLKAMKRALIKNVLSLSSCNAIDKDSVCQLWDSDEEFNILNDWWLTASRGQQAAFVSLRLEHKKSLRQAISSAKKSISIHACFSSDDDKKSLENLGCAVVLAYLLDQRLNGEHLPNADELAELDFLAAGKACREIYGDAVWGSKIFGVWFATNDKEL